MVKMRYKSFTWPNNPKTYTISCERQTAVHKIPMGSFAVQDLGRTCTVLRGEGEFYGAGAYENYLRLLAVFQSDGAGALLHPMWQSAGAWFTRLSLTQEPREDYVAYSFEFCEASQNEAGTVSDARSAADGRKRYHVMQSGQTLWHVCSSYGIEMEKLLEMNPQISNPNEVSDGERVRLA